MYIIDKYKLRCDEFKDAEIKYSTQLRKFTFWVNGSYYGEYNKDDLDNLWMYISKCITTKQPLIDLSELKTKNTQPKESWKDCINGINFSLEYLAGIEDIIDHFRVEGYIDMDTNMIDKIVELQDFFIELSHKI